MLLTTQRSHQHCPSPFPVSHYSLGNNIRYMTVIFISRAYWVGIMFVLHLLFHPWVFSLLIAARRHSPYPVTTLTSWLSLVATEIAGHSSGTLPIRPRPIITIQPDSTTLLLVDFDSIKQVSTHCSDSSHECTRGDVETHLLRPHLSVGCTTTPTQCASNHSGRIGQGRALFVRQ